jgi:hypothetical protein
MKTLMNSLAVLTDRELIACVEDLSSREREATARLLAALAELEDRRLHLAEGCSSLFTYCTQVLHLSEHAAYNRIECARAARRFPIILDLLADGSVNLTTVRLLSPHLNDENYHVLLDEARHKSRFQVEEMVARIRPRPATPSVIRRLPQARTTIGSNSRETLFPETIRVPAASENSSETRRPEPAHVVAMFPGDGDMAGGQAMVLESAPGTTDPHRRPIILPLAPDRYRIQFTASAEMHADLRQAQELMRHQVPDGNPAVILQMALKLLLKKVRKQKFGEKTERSARKDLAPSQGPDQSLFRLRCDGPSVNSG